MNRKTTREYALDQLYSKYHVDGTEFKDVDILIGNIFDRLDAQVCKNCKNFSSNSLERLEYGGVCNNDGVFFGADVEASTSCVYWEGKDD